VTLTAADIRARVLHRDDDLLVLDKPTGLPVHAGTKIQLHLEELLDDIRFGAAEPPRLAHRLDKDTSGCLAMGRNAESTAALARLFRQGLVEKVYWAVVRGGWPGEAGTIDRPLLKIAGETGAKMEVDPAGKAAVTDWRRLDSAGGLVLLELRPRTGRTHQLRAHCAALGAPILGDPIYGPERPAPVPLHLHARRIALRLRPDAPVDVTAPLPAHMAATMAAAGLKENPLF